MISAVGIGATAWCVAATGCAARVMGIASRGVFLLAPSQQVIFVSSERYRSPLTINLDRFCDRLFAVEVGAAAHFSATRLIFPSIEFAISFSEDAVWQCPPPSGVARPRVDQLQTAQAIADGVLARRGIDGLASVLPAVLGSVVAPALSAEQTVWVGQLLAVRQALRANDAAAVLTGLSGMLGQGRGLTPSGDDVVVGLLLMLARSSRLNLQAGSALRMNSQAGSENMLKHVVAAAYQRTTTLSANLIECAADGQGDERLITVADGIVTASASIDKCVEGLLGWGSSSGIAALVGMVIPLSGRGICT